MWTLIGLLGATIGSLVGALFHLSSRIDAQGRDLGSRIDAQGAELRAAIEAQGRDLGARIDAQGAKLDEHLRRHHAS